MVITETATTIGYKKSLVTCRDTPKEAIINANSPIWVKLKPHCIAVFNGLPERITPNVPNVACPKITAIVITIIGIAYSIIIAGSTIIPTDTKKIAPKRSFTGFTSLSIDSASIVSARIDPIINAPNAAENPVLAAITTMPKHSANDTISKVSSPISFLQRFKNSGIR